jgi:hypothetical protein
MKGVDFRIKYSSNNTFPAMQDAKVEIRNPMTADGRGGGIEVVRHTQNLFQLPGSLTFVLTLRSTLRSKQSIVTRFLFSHVVLFRRLQWRRNCCLSSY